MPTASTSSAASPPTIWTASGKNKTASHRADGRRDRSAPKGKFYPQHRQQKSPDSINAAGVFHIFMPFGVRSSAVLRFLLCGELGRTMEYWMSFESGRGYHRAKGAVLHRVNPYDQPPNGGAFFILFLDLKPKFSFAHLKQ